MASYADEVREELERKEATEKVLGRVAEQQLDIYRTGVRVPKHELDEANDLLEELEKGRIRDRLEMIRERNTAHVNLSSTTITLPEMYILSTYLKDGVLMKLELANNSMGPEYGPLLREALQVNETLETLNLLANRLGNDGTDCISDALILNSTLKDLNLAQNGITSVGAKSLASMLSVNHSLTSLYLTGNPILADGRKALEDAIEFRVKAPPLLRHTKATTKGALKVLKFF